MYVQIVLLFLEIAGIGTHVILDPDGEWPSWFVINSIGTDTHDRRFKTLTCAAVVIQSETISHEATDCYRNTFQSNLTANYTGEYMHSMGLVKNTWDQ